MTWKKRLAFWQFYTSPDEHARILCFMVPLVVSFIRPFYVLGFLVLLVVSVVRLVPTARIKNKHTMYHSHFPFFGIYTDIAEK